MKGTGVESTRTQLTTSLLKLLELQPSHALSLNHFRGLQGSGGQLCSRSFGLSAGGRRESAHNQCRRHVTSRCVRRLHLPFSSHQVVTLTTTTSQAMAARLTLAALALGTASGLREGTWVQPAGLEAGRHHDELLLSPAAGKQPHIVTILFDDYVSASPCRNGVLACAAQDSLVHPSRFRFSVLRPRFSVLGSWFSVLCPPSSSSPPVLFHLSPHLSVPRRHVQGWSEAGWHRNYTIGGVAVPSTREVVTPNLDALVREGIELDRMYAYKCCR